MEVIFAKVDGKKEVYDATIWEKPWTTVYSIQEITREKWEWILNYEDAKVAVDTYFPNI